MVRVQVGVDDVRERLAMAQRMTHEGQGLLGVRDVAGVHQRRALAGVAAVQQDVVRRQPAALEDGDAFERVARIHL